MNLYWLIAYPIDRYRREGVDALRLHRGDTVVELDDVIRRPAAAPSERASARPRWVVRGIRCPRQEGALLLA